MCFNLLERYDLNTLSLSGAKHPMNTSKPQVEILHKTRNNFFFSFLPELSEQWLPCFSSSIFWRGALLRTWSIKLTIPGKVRFTVRALTVEVLFGQQDGAFLETRASLHLFSVDDDSRISRCPQDHLDLLLFPGCQMSRNPQQVCLSHWISRRRKFTSGVRGDDLSGES